MELTPLALLLGASAALLMGFSKTGLPGAATPAVALMAAAFPQDAELSVGAMLPVLLIGDVFAVARFGRHADWPRLGKLLPYVVSGMVPGYLVLWWFRGNELRPWLGGLVLALLGLEWVRQRQGWTRVPDRWWFAGTAGLLAGFSTTVANAGGPVMTLYLLSQGLLKESFVGTCAWFFFLLNLAKVVPFWSAGMLTPQTVGFGVALGPIALAGAVAGTWLLPRISQRAFQTLMLLLAAVAGLWLVLA
jgi:uncharacterized protein